MANVISIPIGMSVIVVNAATGTGASPILFTFQPRPTGGDFSALITASGTFSVGTASLGVSYDGGTTFDAFQAAYDFKATPVQSLTTLVAGPIYQYTVAAFTGTSITLTVFRN